MPRGLRQRAEFVSGIPRRNPSAPTSSIPTEFDNPSHIDIRVIRQISTAETFEAPQIPYEYDWDLFLKKLGKYNHHLGSARTLGSVAVTLLPSTRLNMILQNSRPKEFFHPKKKVALIRRMASHLNDFIETTGSDYRNIAFEHVAAESSVRYVEALDRVKNGIDSDADDIVIENHKYGISTQENDTMNDYTFGPSRLAIGGLELYGRRFGIDLSKNEQLYVERSALTTFMRKDLKLDISPLQQNVRMHVSMFDLHDHVGHPTLTYEEGTLPPLLYSDLPKVEVYDISNRE